MEPPQKSQEIFIETHRVGSILRISAIDAETGTEAVFQAPASTGKTAIRRLAVSKLRYILSRKKD